MRTNSVEPALSQRCGPIAGQGQSVIVWRWLKGGGRESCQLLVQIVMLQLLMRGERGYKATRFGRDTSLSLLTFHSDYDLA